LVNENPTYAKSWQSVCVTHSLVNLWPPLSLASTGSGQLSGFDLTPGHALASRVGGPLPIVAERSAGLLTVALVFLASALTASLYDVDNLTYRLGWEPSPETSLLPNLMLCAAVLLISSAVYAVAERRTRAHR
jgi:hypothetical protein